MEPCRGAPRRAGEVVQAASREKSEIEFSTNRRAAPDNMDTDNCEARKVFPKTLFSYRGKTAFRGMFWVCPPPPLKNKEHCRSSPQHVGAATMYFLYAAGRALLYF